MRPYEGRRGSAALWTPRALTGRFETGYAGLDMETLVITHDQADYILGLEESHFVDLKGKEISPKKLTNSLSALANADGGELYVGIDEDEAKGQKARRWQGFIDIEEANGHIQAFDEAFPLGSDIQHEFLRTDAHSGLILHLIVHKSREIRTASNGTVYLRRGAQNLPQRNPEEIERLRRAKGLISHENATVAADPVSITNSAAIIGFMLEIVPEGEPETWLAKQRLLLDAKPTVAGLLLFADEPQVFIPKASVKIYRYKTTDAEGARETLAFNPISIDGCLYDQIRAAVERTTELIEGMEILGPDGLEPVRYPAEALHEIITNAVLHRDYAFADDVHVRIFDNRVEVESPGALPAHITPKNILKERFARNASIVRLINKFPDPPNKDVGEGLNTAFAAMRRLQLRDPKIEEGENSVRVVIRHENLASPEKLIMEYLGSNAEINNRRAREITHIDSEYRVRRILKGLIAVNEVEKVPGKQSNATAYRRKRTRSEA
jgi:ATP-dependent DNA helicase RecG